MSRAYTILSSHGAITWYKKICGGFYLGGINVNIKSMKKMPLLFQHRLPVSVFALSFLLIVVGLALVYVDLAEGDVNRPLIVHFDAFRGIDFFGTRSEVFNVIFIALAVVFMNLFLAVSFFERERILSYFLAFSSFLFSFLILIALAVIISVN